MSFAFRRVSTMRKLLWASLAINLFLIGAVFGSLASGLPLFHTFMPPPPPAFDRDSSPPVRLLTDVRKRLSESGKEAFDEEFSDLLVRLRNRPTPRMVDESLRNTLKDPDVTDDEIHAAFDGLHQVIRQDLDWIMQHMANLAVKLSTEDRLQMALMRPSGMPPPPE